MKLQVARAPLKEAVQKWVKQERRSEGHVRTNPEILLQFFWKPRFSAHIFLYHKPKGKQPKREYIFTTNSVGELVLAIETILNEWERQT